MKDQQLEESRARMSELKKAHTNLSKVVSKLKGKVKYIEDQWERSAFKIKGNILAQCQVICPKVNFSKVGLDKHVVSEHIEVTPDDNEERDLESPESKPTDPAADF